MKTDERSRTRAGETVQRIRYGISSISGKILIIKRDRGSYISTSMKTHKMKLNCTPRPFTAILIVFSFLMLIASCSKDDSVEGEDDMSQTDDGPIDTNDDGPAPSGSIFFEDTFVLDEERMLVNFVLPQATYDSFIQGDGDVTMVTEKAYEYFNDEFDYIVILSVETVQPDGLFFGRSTSVQNQVQGIGSGIFDGTSNYGSAGRLKSVIYMPRTEYVRTGPFLHEIAHTWANHGFIPTTVGGHWGYASAGGQLGGFDELVSLGGNSYRGRLNGGDGFGTFANGGNSVPYGNIELYVMGLIGADELQSVQVAVNPAPGSTFGEFTADAIDTHTASDLIAQHGARVPNAENSQKEFSALAIIISTEQLSSAKIEDVSSDLENFSRTATPDSSWGSTYNFWLATDEKASIRFKVLEADIQ
ncbi:hypothetical protein WIW50_10945 [Flavobacteriaceae bacterium 3-367]